MDLRSTVEPTRWTSIPKPSGVDTFTIMRRKAYGRTTMTWFYDPRGRFYRRLDRPGTSSWFVLRKPVRSPRASPTVPSSIGLEDEVVYLDTHGAG